MVTRCLLRVTYDEMHDEIYDEIYSHVTMRYGLCDQVRVVGGQEFNLVGHILRDI